MDFREDTKYQERLRELVDDLRGKSKRPPLGVPQLTNFEVWENSIGLKMVLLPAGEFLMGSVDLPIAGPPHSIHITEPLLMGIYPVTQGQWITIEMTNPSGSRGDLRLPVVSVNWLEAIRFCNGLSRHERLPLYYHLKHEDVTIAGGAGYRLPTEAEWEYACRAGSDGAYCFGNDENLLGQYAWFVENSGRLGLTMHPVGEKQPNAWGLYDTHGNVEEWCWDWYGEDYYRSSSKENPTGPSTGVSRMYRGGSWCSEAESCRSAFRCRGEPAVRLEYLGLRVARNLV